jgi:hypothetical protein
MEPLAGLGKRHIGDPIFPGKGSHRQLPHSLVQLLAVITGIQSCLDEFWPRGSARNAQLANRRIPTLRGTVPCHKQRSHDISSLLKVAMLVPIHHIQHR